MRTFAQAANASQRTSPGKHSLLARPHVGQGHAAVQRPSEAIASGAKGGSIRDGARVTHDLSRIPVHATPPITLQHRESAGPLSNSAPSGQHGEDKLQEPPNVVGDLRGIGVEHDGETTLGLGAPLPRGLRFSLETYFKTSLDHVKVHTGPQSQAAADHLKARAFTLGRDIHLGPEGIRASGRAKAALLAHEVAHTLQQGPITARAKPKVGAPDDAFEQQADQLASGFSRFNRNPQDSVALKLRDSMPMRQVSGGSPVIQLSRVSTHFGEFEDYQYQNLTDGAGTEVGVEMYMKFHPGTNVRADLIGLTQAAEGKSNGAQITQGLYGQHSATSGAGVGSFIDRVADRANPLYATTNALNAGGDAAKLADYQITAPTTLTPAQQTTTAASTGVTGRHHTGGAIQGFRKVVAGAFVTQPAELYDAPVLPGAGANSEQVFETAALAIAGPQNGTYYGSVEWGWRKNALGAFSRLPFRVVSQGIPSVTFLTAANIWNQSKASFGFIATIATNLLDASLHVVSAIPNNAELTPTGRQAAGGGATYFEVSYGGNTGFVVSTAVRPAAIGAATVDLPVPMIQKVSNPAGTTMILLTPLASLIPGQPPATTLALAAGTRVITTRCMAPQGILTNHSEGEVVDGPNTGTRGYFAESDLALEARGTH